MLYGKPVMPELADLNRGTAPAVVFGETADMARIILKHLSDNNMPGSQTIEVGRTYRHPNWLGHLVGITYPALVDGKKVQTYPIGILAPATVTTVVLPKNKLNVVHIDAQARSWAMLGTEPSIPEPVPDGAAVNFGIFRSWGAVYGESDERTLFEPASAEVALLALMLNLDYSDGPEDQEGSENTQVA